MDHVKFVEQSTFIHLLSMEQSCHRYFAETHYLCCYLTLRHRCDVFYGTVVSVLCRVLRWYADDYFECFLSVMLVFFTSQEQSPSQTLAFTLYVLETPWKRKITMQHATGTPKCSQHDSVACFWRSCINL